MNSNKKEPPLGVHKHPHISFDAVSNKVRRTLGLTNAQVLTRLQLERTCIISRAPQAGSEKKFETFRENRISETVVVQHKLTTDSAIIIMMNVVSFDKIDNGSRT